MEELLTAEEKKYIGRVGRYVQSMGKKYASIYIDANDYDSQSEIADIDWNLITNFEYDENFEIPSGFIVILQKIFNYIDQSGKYEYPDDVDGVNYNSFSIALDTTKKELTIKHHYSYYSEGGEGELEFEEPELMEEFREQLESDEIEIPDNGVLSVYYSGGGDDGALEGSFDEVSHSVPANMEDFCYNQLSSNYGGWENNEGGQGRFEFNFNDGTIFLYHTENFEEQVSNTLFEVEY